LGYARELLEHADILEQRLETMLMRRCGVLGAQR